MATAPAKRPYAPRLPPEERREQLLDAAMGLIIDEGYGGVSMEGIARRAGVTKPVVLQVEGPTGPVTGMDKKPHSGFSATTTIDRKHFGLEWNKALETGGLLVGEKVELNLEIEAVKQAAQQAA